MHFQYAAAFEEVSYEYASCAINTDNKSIRKPEQGRGYLRALGV